MKETCQERYGVDFYTQTEEFRNHLSEIQYEKWKYVSEEDKNNRVLKMKETCQERYGVESFTQTIDFLEKQHETKKKNKSFNTSKIENNFKEYLNEQNINYIYQYSSELYPFECDFYFPDYDLYVEIQGHWTHGFHPFNKNNEEDNKLLYKWIEKTETRPSYKDAIYIWTERDVLKRKTAKENNINYLEVFSNKLDILINMFNDKIKELD